VAISIRIKMTTNYKKHKRTHSNQQTIEPYYTIRYLFIFVTTLGKIKIAIVNLNVPTTVFSMGIFCILLSVSDGVSHSSRDSQAETRTFGSLRSKLQLNHACKMIYIYII